MIKNTPTQGMLNVLSWTYQQYCQATFLKPVWQKVVIRILQELRNTELTPEEVSHINGFIDGFPLAARKLKTSARRVFPYE